MAAYMKALLLLLTTLLLAASCTAATSVSRKTLAAAASTNIKDCLTRHNTYRAKHKAPALTWDDKLAQQAQNYAASTGCVMKHSGITGVGENLAQGYNSFNDAVDAWYNEVEDYNFNSPGFSLKTGHFTQLVWKSSTKLGCGYVPSCKLLVCQYAPPGNVQGQFPANVVRAA